MVEGEDKEVHGDQQGRFDSTKVTFKKWEEYERAYRKKLKGNTSGIYQDNDMNELDEISAVLMVTDPSTTINTIQTSNDPTNMSSNVLKRYSDGIRSVPKTGSKYQDDSSIGVERRKTIGPREFGNSWAK